MGKGKALHIVLSLLTIGAGCGPEAATDPGPVGTLASAYRSGQGTLLQGGSLDLLRVSRLGAVGADGSPYDRLRIERASLVATRGGTDFTGAALQGARLQATNLDGTPIELLIQTVRDHQPKGGASSGAGERDYKLTYLDGAGNPRPLCGDAGPNRVNWALPMDRIWFPTGTYSEDRPDLFTFACLEGVLVKCSDWGYKPYAPDPERKKAHQSCTRMARADYCGIGDPHTFDGTPIDLYDRFNIQVRRKNPGGVLPREAAWREGAQSGALCLSKKRWNTIKLGGYCRDVLPDPRENRDMYCDDYKGRDDMIAHGAYLINDSAFLDVGFYRWAHPTNGDQYTTAHYYFGGEPASGGSGTPITALGYSTPPRFEGAAFSPAIFDLGFTPPATVVLLSTWKKVWTVGTKRWTEFLTTTAAPPAGYSRVRDEGYIYAASAPGAVELWTYHNPTTHDYLTTTDHPISEPGYGPGVSQGFLLR